MQETLLLAIGAILIVAGIALAFRQKQAPITALILILGVAMCLIPKAQKLAFKVLGVEATIEGQVSDAATNVVAQIAPLQLSVQKLQDALDKQEAFNKTVTARLDKLGLAAAGAPAQPDINKTSPAFAKNGQYTIFVFYKPPRANEAQALVKSLSETGFQASAIATSFAEAPQLSADGSTFIVPTNRGVDIGASVEALAKKQGLQDVTLGGPYALRRGDVQIFLY